MPKVSCPNQGCHFKPVAKTCKGRGKLKIGKKGQKGGRYKCAPKKK